MPLPSLKQIAITLAVVLVMVVVAAWAFGPNAVLGDLWGWPLNAAVWGTAGQWISSVVAAASLLVAVTIVLRDRNYRRTEHVEHAIAWVDDKDITFMNGNTLPVIEPVLHFVPKNHHEQGVAEQYLDEDQLAKTDPNKRQKPQKRKFYVTESGSTSNSTRRATFRSGESASATWVFLLPMHHSLYD